MASLYDAMNDSKNKDKDKNNIKSSMGYEVKNYRESLDYLKPDDVVEITQQDNGVLSGGYIAGVNELVGTPFDLTSINFSPTGFSIGNDMDKRLAALSFVAWRGYVAIKTQEDAYALVKVRNDMDDTIVCGTSVCGKNVSPPVSLDEKIIEAGKSNTEQGSYRCGCAIDGTGMFKDYLIHFYGQEAIGIGLKNGSIQSSALERLISERCLYAEVSFPGISKSAFFSVTDSYKTLGQNQLYLYIDAPLCTTSALSEAFTSKLKDGFESVFKAADYDFKKGKLSNCDSSSYKKYSEKKSNEILIDPITISRKGKLGVRFFSFEEKKSQVETILGPMPNDFYKTNVNFVEDMNNAVEYTGAEFVRGSVEELRRTYCTNREVPSATIAKLKQAYNTFRAQYNANPDGKYVPTRSGEGCTVGVNCGYFVIPSGYPINLGERFKNRNQILPSSTRSSAAYSDSRLGSNGNSSDLLLRGYDDSVYEAINKNAKGEIHIKCNKYIGQLWTEFFAAIYNYYGDNLAKVAPCLCNLTCGWRTKDDALQAGMAHRTGRALDFDHNHNYGSKDILNKEKSLNYKGFFDIAYASGVTWPIRDGKIWDWMHFQWG